jgi:hypothetical protein
MTRVIELTVCLTLVASAPALAQGRPQTPPPPPPGVTPQPVGRSGDTAPAPTATQTAPRTPPASQAAGTTTRPAPAATATAPPRDGAPAFASVLPPDPAPTDAQLGVPVYPGAKFLKSFDAGQGQRYYLFGTTASFAELVMYYRTQLKDKGDLVYDVPPVHMFEVGRFREETMAFPPGVTVKDYTWGGKKGYLVPTPGATPSHYPTVIQIVPVTAR